MKGHWKFDTPAGTVQIIPTRDGRHAIVFKGESLGSYDHQQKAADDASHGCTWPPSCGTNLGSLGLPTEIVDWDWVPTGP